MINMVEEQDSAMPMISDPKFFTFLIIANSNLFFLVRVLNPDMGVNSLAMTTIKRVVVERN